MSLLPPISRASRIERQAYKWVMKMLDDPGHHAALLERWLAQHPEHRVVYKRVAVEVGYASDAASQIPALRVEAVINRGQPRWKPTGASYLAAAVIGFLIYILAWQSVPSARPPEAPVKSPTELVSIENGTKSLTLADGSRITLLGASALKVAYSPPERAIQLLRGRARFEVEHDASRPFVVYVGGGKVTAVGTIFEVSAEQKVVVHLVSGRIRVSLPAGGEKAVRPDVMLNAGDRIGFNGAANVNGPLAVADVARPLGKHIQSFDDIPVSAVIDLVNSASAQKVILLDDRTGGRKIFADLDISDADAVARKLALMFGLVIDRSVAGQIRLSEKK